MRARSRFKHEQPKCHGVAWAEYNHSQRYRPLNCGVFQTAYATREEAERAVWEDIEEDVRLNILGLYDPVELPGEYSGKSAAQIARDLTKDDGNGVFHYNADFDDREVMYVVRPQW